MSRRGLLAHLTEDAMKTREAIARSSVTTGKGQLRRATRRILVISLLLPLATVGLSGTASATTVGPASSSPRQPATSTSSISLRLYADVFPENYTVSGPLLSGKVIFGPHGATGSGQLAGPNGGQLNLSLALFRFSTAAEAPSYGWITLVDVTNGVALFCPVFGQPATWGPSSVLLGALCLGRIGGTSTGWLLDPFTASNST
jgi:hypothetical protein